MGYTDARTAYRQGPGGFHLRTGDLAPDDSRREPEIYRKQHSAYLETVNARSFAACATEQPYRSIAMKKVDEHEYNALKVLRADQSIIDFAGAVEVKLAARTSVFAKPQPQILSATAG
jgi:hypothetical protein